MNDIEKNDRRSNAYIDDVWLYLCSWLFCNNKRLFLRGSSNYFFAGL